LDVPIVSDMDILFDFTPFNTTFQVPMERY
jgi:hypothetical protein